MVVFRRDLALAYATVAACAAIQVLRQLQALDRDDFVHIDSVYLLPCRSLPVVRIQWKPVARGACEPVLRAWHKSLPSNHKQAGRESPSLLSRYAIGVGLTDHSL